MFYLVGASGAAKDSLIDYARARSAEHQELVFAHRYVTRPAGAAGENQVVLPDAEFLLRKRRGLFVMDWESHGALYGIGTEINYWLAMALSVVVNGSRGYLDRALKRYPDMTVVWISAAPDPVAVRRARRRHSTRREIEVHGSRRPMASAHAGCRVVHVAYEGSGESAGENLLAVLHGARR